MTNLLPFGIVGDTMNSYKLQTLHENRKTAVGCDFCDSLVSRNNIKTHEEWCFEQYHDECDWCMKIFPEPDLKRMIDKKALHIRVLCADCRNRRET